MPKNTARRYGDSKRRFFVFSRDVLLFSPLRTRTGTMDGKKKPPPAPEHSPGRSPVLFGPPFGMSEREYETARLAAEGLYNQEIAERLGLSVNTVKTHLRKAYRKSGASSRPTLRKILQKMDAERQKSPGSGDATK